MRWIVKKPKIGTVKIVTRFAWFLVLLSNGETVWLEFYRKRLQYKNELEYLGRDDSRYVCELKYQSIYK